jgi:CubicO group peptidase (beta-lactamase class C family)
MSTGGLSRVRLARVHDVMAGYVERGEVPGLVTAISRRGELHVDAIGMQAIGGDTPMSRDTIFRIASMTKPITAAAAMILVEECKLRLDDAIDAFLPELANRRVLCRLDALLDDTVPANRPITLRDLLTFRCGLGAVMLPPSAIPIQKAMEEAGLAPGPNPVVHSPDSYMGRAAIDASAGREVDVSHRLGDPWCADRARIRAKLRGFSAGAHLRAAWHERYRFSRASRQAPSASHQLPT